MCEEEAEGSRQGGRDGKIGVGEAGGQERGGELPGVHQGLGRGGGWKGGCRGKRRRRRGESGFGGVQRLQARLRALALLSWLLLALGVVVVLGQVLGEGAAGSGGGGGGEGGERLEEAHGQRGKEEGCPRRAAPTAAMGVRYSAHCH